MMLYFATFFDKNYLIKGIALVQSLQENTKVFKIYILCLDDQTFYFFQSNASRFPEVHLIKLSDLENEYSELSTCKKNRNLIEYYFTLSPFLPIYILDKYNISFVCTLDADIFFFNDPKPLFENSNFSSITITPHKFSKENSQLIKYGIYNVSFQIFRNNEVALFCLHNWKKSCIEWCRDELDEQHNRFADQLYLNNWLELYPGQVTVLEDDDVGLAVWNVNNYQLSWNKSFQSNSKRIIFYHFHNFQNLNKHFALSEFNFYNVHYNNIIGSIYLYYWNILIQIEKEFCLTPLKGIRYSADDNLFKRLFNSKSFFFRLFNSKIYLSESSKWPFLLKKILIKIYGRIN